MVYGCPVASMTTAYSFLPSGCGTEPVLHAPAVNQSAETGANQRATIGSPLALPATAIKAAALSRQRPTYIIALPSQSAAFPGLRTRSTEQRSALRGLRKASGRPTPQEHQQQAPRRFTLGKIGNRGACYARPPSSRGSSDWRRLATVATSSAA